MLLRGRVRVLCTWFVMAAAAGAGAFISGVAFSTTINFAFLSREILSD